MKRILVILLLIFTFAAAQSGNASIERAMITLCSTTEQLIAVAAMLFFLIGVGLGIVWFLSSRFTKKESQLAKILCMIFIGLGIISVLFYVLVPYILPLFVSPEPYGGNICDPQYPRYPPFDPNCSIESEGINCTRIIY